MKFSNDWMAALICGCMCTVSGFAEAPLVPAPGGMLQEEVRQAQSRLSSMSHGFHRQEEWAGLFDHLAQLIDRAEAKGRDDLVMHLTSSQALVQAQALGQNSEAAKLLEGILARYRDLPDPGLRRIYVQLADLYAHMGDEKAVASLIMKYRNSKLHDPAPFKYQGGGSSGESLQITRPHAHGEESLTVTAMENSRKQAILASGRLAEDFSAEDLKGRTVELRAYRGQVVLLDFYHPKWPGWAESLPRLKRVYQRFHGLGFEIIGIPLVAGAPSKVKLPWVVLNSSRGLSTRYRVFGDATNFLIDQDGRIAGQNLTPADLQLQLSERLKPEL